VKLILPALTEATSPYWRPIKYSLFPPLGLATLAAYLDPDTEVTLEDEHVQRLRLDDRPDLVVIQVYITNARRAYRLADHYRAWGAHVALGGLHVTSLPDEAAAHADSIFLGPGEHTFPAFLRDLATGRPLRRYASAAAQGRILTHDWDLYDTRHVVFRPGQLSAAELERGYWRAYRTFYRWDRIVRAAAAHASPKHALKHLAYSAGWKKFERAWNLVIRIKQLSQMRPALEAVLSPAGGGRHAERSTSARSTLDARRAGT
jgi:radical SAM superfamily enzyme YgiQ (UPF0313 family)